MHSSVAQTIRILIVDDEPDLVELVTYNFTREGFKVSSTPNGEEALEKIKNESFDLIILDLMLPGLQGNEICHMIRNNPKTEAIPIIMLTAKGDVVDKIRGLETGADDYITKPFSPKELIARVNSVLRRTATRSTQESTFTIGGVRIDKERYSVSKNNVPVNLSSTEFKILVYLAERRGRVFSRDQILDAIWQHDAFVEPRTVDVHIRRLRTHIEDDPSQPRYVKTRRGVGYYIDAE